MRSLFPWGFWLRGCWLARCAEAQSQQGADQSSAADASGSGAAAKPKPKKVWTNDDMGEVTGTISVVGTPRAEADTDTPPEFRACNRLVPSEGMRDKTPDCQE